MNNLILQENFFFLFVMFVRFILLKGGKSVKTPGKAALLDRGILILSVAEYKIPGPCSLSLA